MSLLSIEKITKEYDGVVALDQLSLNVEQGSIKGLIGPNGAGKSTLFHLISGVEKPDSGKIYFKGSDITSMAPHEISALGLGRTFQTLQILGNMTVVENVMAGMHRRLKGGLFSYGLWLALDQKVGKRDVEGSQGDPRLSGSVGQMGIHGFPTPLWQTKASGIRPGPCHEAGTPPFR